MYWVSDSGNSNMTVILLQISKALIKKWGRPSFTIVKKKLVNLISSSIKTVKEGTILCLRIHTYMHSFETVKFMSRVLWYWPHTWFCWRWNGNISLESSLALGIKTPMYTKILYYFNKGLCWSQPEWLCRVLTLPLVQGCHFYRCVRCSVNMLLLRSGVGLGFRAFWSWSSSCLVYKLTVAPSAHSRPHWYVQLCLVQAETECQNRYIYITVIVIVNERSGDHVQQTGISPNLHIIFEMIFISQMKETDA